MKQTSIVQWEERELYAIAKMGHLNNWLILAVQQLNVGLMRSVVAMWQCDKWQVASGRHKYRTQQLHEKAPQAAAKANKQNAG